MKRTNIRKAGVALLVGLTVAGTAVAEGTPEARGYGRGRAPVGVESHVDLVADIAPAELSQDEEESLLFMIEEEKLARDVYGELYEAWGIPIFANIARSEQTHMDAISLLLDRYEIAPPASLDRSGVFENEELATLYAGLVEAGQEDLQGALEVGATVEDVDIADLARLVEETDNDDIRITYQNLLRGSRNHLRSFAGQLESRYGVSYVGQYTEQTMIERILSTPNEAGPVTDPDFVFGAR